MQPERSQLVLGSSSPRRIELIEKIATPTKIISPSVDEEAILIDETYPRPVVEAKMAAIPDQGEALVITADTVVHLNGTYYFKPVDRNDARRILLALKGQEHQVITGVCLRQGTRTHYFQEVSSVQFRDFSDAELESYLDLKQYQGKSGAYACQGAGNQLIIEAITGSIDNVIGLPTERLAAEIKRFLGK